MQNVLIGQGYDIKDSAIIAPHVWKIAADKSGLTEAKINFETAQYNYQNTTLRAPFNGVIANLKLKEHNMASVSDPFCRLIDNSVFNAEFQVMESELGNIALGQPVAVVPFSADSVSQLGNITEINPLIDDNGLVTVKAQIKNLHKKLFEGMNVRISIRKPCPDKLVVPKQAVLQRQGKEVVFTLENGRAIWNYVKTGDENTGYYTITEGLEPGMIVIISNNLNLGHDAEVMVSEK
jgi:RND family efflux transporter MFP subunit